MFNKNNLCSYDMVQEHFFYIVDDQGCYSWILMFYDLGIKKNGSGIRIGNTCLPVLCLK
jgi:hypothetical protein